MPKIPFALQWSIQANRLFPLKDSNNAYLNSISVTNIPEFDYHLSIYPNGNVDENKGRTWIFLHVVFKNINKVEAYFTLTIESKFSKTFHWNYDKTIGMGCFNCDTKIFFDPENKFIVDGKFTVKLNGIFKFESVTDSPFIGQQKWNGGILGDGLWKSNEEKVFTIVTKEGNEIKIHKFIFDSLSDVFKAMFNSNCKESEEKKVEIVDFPSIVVETAIKLIYNCNFESSLSLDELTELLRFFDKYQIPLKEQVEQYLIGQISAATVCNLTNCSVYTNSCNLKKECIEFLSGAFESKTALHDIDDLDKDIALQILKNSLYRIV